MQVRLMALLPLVFLLVTSLAAATDVEYSHTSGVGTFEGAQGWANPTSGTAHASYSFNLLPARGAVQSQLRLAYASSSDVQEAGTGWGFGLPIIERKPPQGGAPSYRQSERVSYNGRPLVFIRQVSSLSSTMRDGTQEQLPAWSVGWYYYRLQDDASHLRFFWSPLEGPEQKNGRKWVVQDPSGITLEFGQPSTQPQDGDSALDQERSGAIHRWRLVRQYDAHCAGDACNLIVYHWHNLGRTSDEMLLLTDIYDTPLGGSFDPAKFAHHVHIAYEPHPASGDPGVNTITYTRTWKQKYQLRIKRIDVAGNGEDPQAARTVVRRYHLGYQLYLRRSLLTSITEEGAACASAQEVPLPPGPFGGTTDYEAPETSCPRLPPTTFEYATPHWGPSSEPGLQGANPSAYFRASPESPPPAGLLFPYPGGVNLLDVDRDGAMDLVLHPLRGDAGRVYLTESTQADIRLRYKPLSKADSDLLSIYQGFTLVDPLDLKNAPSAFWRRVGANQLQRMRITQAADAFTWSESSKLDFARAPVAVGDIDGNGTQDVYESYTVGSNRHTGVYVSNRYGIVDDRPNTTRSLFTFHSAAALLHCGPCLRQSCVTS
ncbi:SpvB/TcaC N-terminal domain-containing protein [Pendulispora albinea]|uniref:Uncharacterized protein n=1 Tax=Pendulispora albinea TaxID=2741071 RepID=A0ABZ2LNJ9_9BACT